MPLTCNVTYRIDGFAAGVNASGIADDGFTLAAGAPVWLADTCSGLMAPLPFAESATALAGEAGVEATPQEEKPIFGPPGFRAVERPILDAGQQPTVENVEVPPTTGVQR